MPLTISDLSASQEAYLNWAMREFLVLWASQSLVSKDGTFTLDQRADGPKGIPSRFEQDIEFGILVREYAKSKSFLSKRSENTLTSKGWKAATSQLKKG